MTSVSERMQAQWRERRAVLGIPESKLCERCGVEFHRAEIRQNDEHWLQRRFCSQACCSAWKADTRGWDDETATCASCGERKPRSEFHRSGTASGVSTYCRPCFNARRRETQTAGDRRRANLKALYGITPERYAELLHEQGGVCAICRQPETKVHAKTGLVMNLAVDHDRSCCDGKRSCGRCIRGLLCSRCNHAIGLLDDDPDRMAAAAAYVIEREGGLDAR